MKVLKCIVLVFAVALSACAGCASDSGEEQPWETSEDQPAEETRRLAGLSIEPTRATVIIGTQRDLAVLASYDDGDTADVTADVSWRVGNEDVVRVDGHAVTAVSPGSSTVTAVYEGFTAETLITVPSARPTGLTVEPASANIGVGETVRLRAEATLSDGTTTGATELVDWVSEDVEIVAVSNDPPNEGIARGVADGTAVVRAVLGELEAEATVTVGSTSQLVALEIAPPSLRLVLDQTSRVQVLGRYSDGRITDVTTLSELNSSDQTIATVAGSGVVTANAVGETRIEAQMQGEVATAPVTVTDAEVIAIEVTPPDAATTQGGGVDFDATALLDDGTVLDFDDTVDWRSTDNAVATVDDHGLAIGDGTGQTRIEARFGELTGTADLEVVDATLRSIALEPVDPEGVVGTRWNFVATGRYDGNRIADLSYSCDWQSSNPTLVTVQRPGAAVANGPGTSVVTCEWQGLVGRSTVTVTPNDLESLTIEPATATVGVGGTAQLHLVGRHMDGTTSDLTESAVWSTDAAAVAVSNLVGARGEVTGIAPGNAEVRADFAGLHAVATVRVSDAALTSITLEPDPVVVPAGATIGVTATGRYDDGTERDVTAQAAWATDDPALARVGNGPDAGRVRGITPGDTAVIATVGELSVSVDVQVGAATVDRLELDPADAITTRGLRTNYTATAIYTDGTEIDVTDLATWSVDDTSLAFIGNAGPRGQLVAQEVGQTTVRADWNGVEGTTSVTIEGAELQSVAVTPVVAQAPIGVDTQLVAMATYTDGTHRNITGSAAWSSDKPGIAEVNASGLVEPMQPGDARITASFQGMSATATFTVTDASITEVQVIPFDATIAAGDKMWFQAVALFSDGTHRDVTRRSTWTTTDDDVVHVQSVAYLAGTALAQNPGMAKIRANYEGVIGEATVTVTDATVTEIELFPTTYELAVGTEVFLTAQAIYSDGTSRNVNYLGTWRSSAPDVAAVSNTWQSPGLVTAHASGETTITIDYQGVTATAEITVSDATLEAIQVFPFTSSITVGSPVWFQATGVFSDGRSVWLTRDVTWTSSDDSVAAISNGRWSEGRTLGVGPGQATIEATWNGVTGSASIVVTDKQISTIQVTPFVPRTPAGYGEFFQAVAIFDDATSRNVTQLATWETTDPMIASVGNVWWTNGLVLTHEPGQVTVSAGWQGAEGSTSLTVTDALLASIDVEPRDASLLPGEVIEYSATGHFDDGTEMDVTPFATWLSSETDVADVSNAWGYRGEATAFTPGTTDISANNAGVAGSTTLEVR